MQSVIFDTNVWIGALLGEGACNRVIRLSLEGKIKPLIGQSLFSEYEALMAREALFSSCKLNYQERMSLFDIFLARCEWTQVYYGWRPNLRDESDNHLIELAIAGNAKCLITRNLRDFFGMNLQFPQLKIVSPEAFLKENLK